MPFKYIKFKIFTALINPLFYISALVISAGTGIYVFLVQKFFSGAGTTNLYSFFTSISFLSIFIIPLLCFNEIRNIEELMPIDTLKLYLAKAVAVFLEYIILLIPLFFIPACMSLFGDVDLGQLFTGTTGILLAGFSTVCFCLFIQAISKNQIASILLQISLLAITAFIHLLLLYFNSIPLLLFFSKAFSFTWHYESFGKGIFDTRNVFYFLFSAFAFLQAAIFITEFNKGKNSLKSKKTVVLWALILIFGFLDSNKFYLRKDLSFNHKTTVSSYSKKLAQSFENTVNITYYRSSILASLYPQVREISDYLNEFSYCKNINYSEKDPAKEKLENVLELNGISGRQIQTLGTNKTEYQTVYSAIVMEYEGDKQIIPFILAGNSLEYDIAIRLKQLLQKKYFVVNVLCGNGMSLKSDYSYVTPWLNSQNFIVNEINLDYDISLQLEETPVLVMFGSDMLTEKQCNSIINYLANGGRAFLALSPYTVDIENNWYITESENNTFLKKLEALGIGFGENLVKDISSSRITMETNQSADGSESSHTFNQTINYSFWINLLAQENAPQGITLFWPAEISCMQEDFIPYLFSSNSGWYVSPDRFSSVNLFRTNPFEQEEKASEIHYSSKVLGISNTKHNIVCIPDQYFANSLMLGYNGGKFGDYRNLDFLATEVLKLFGEGTLATIHQKSTLSGNTGLYKIYDEKNFIDAKNRTLFTVFALNPLLILLLAITVYIFRKKEKFLC